MTKFLTVRGLPASLEVEETWDIPEAQNISQHFFSAYGGTSFWGASYFSSTLPPLNLAGNGFVSCHREISLWNTKHMFHCFFSFCKSWWILSMFLQFLFGRSPKSGIVKQATPLLFSLSLCFLFLDYPEHWWVLHLMKLKMCEFCC